MVIENQLQAKHFKLLCVLAPAFKNFNHVLPTNLQSMLQNSSTLGRSVVTLATPRLVVQIKEAQKLVQLSVVAKQTKLLCIEVYKQAKFDCSKHAPRKHMLHPCWHYAFFWIASLISKQ